MAKYCSTKYNRTFIEVPIVPINETEVTSNNVIFCVDISGSMAGSPLQTINQILKSIYEKTNIKYPLWCYDTSVYKSTIDSVLTNPLKAGGGTAFVCVMSAILDYLQENVENINIIFLTDGCDGSVHETQEKMNEIAMIKSTIGYQFTINVLGFTECVNNAFLDTVRLLGNVQGTFSFAANASELETSFMNMFQLSATSRDIKITVKDQEYNVTALHRSTQLLSTSYVTLFFTLYYGY